MIAVAVPLQHHLGPLHFLGTTTELLLTTKGAGGYASIGEEMTLPVQLPSLMQHFLAIKLSNHRVGNMNLHPGANRPQSISFPVDYYNRKLAGKPKGIKRVLLECPTTHKFSFKLNSIERRENCGFDFEALKATVPPSVASTDRHCAQLMLILQVFNMEPRNLSRQKIGRSGKL